ncbi:MAG: AAA family ATPase [Planctomycetota bacterium]|nr:MAG: AAA family ATPase [Planctomycetota bacterium]
MPQPGLIPLSKLPDGRFSDRDAVFKVYRDELNWITDKIWSGLSVLIECEKMITTHVFAIIRQRLKESSPDGSEIPLQVIMGETRTEEDAGPPRGLLVSMMAQIEAFFRANMAGHAVLVLPYLDLLTTTTRSSLTDATKEVIGWCYRAPDVRVIGFKDPSFELPRVMSDLFPARTSLIGISREKLPQIILRNEARKFGVDEFNPYVLFKYVSGLNPVKFRRIMKHISGYEDFNPQTPEMADNLYSEIRKMTVEGTTELPQVDLHEDIGGYGEVKDRLEKDIIQLVRKRDSLTDPKEIEVVESIIPRGIIFTGPPGTGKTFFAKALAHTLDATVTIVSGPELKSKWVGESEENLRRIFHEARASAPAVIVFDELDSFASRRGTYAGDAGVTHSMVNQLLTEMDGFRKEELVFIVGTTNFVESIDPALLRPGRFEFNIEIGYPISSDRREIAGIYRRKWQLDMPDDVLEYLVEKTGGYVDLVRAVKFSGDHIEAICRALKREELRKGELKVDRDAINRVLETKLKRVLDPTPEERKTIAVHECGHALVSALHVDAPDVAEINVETGDPEVLGYSRQQFYERSRLLTKRQMLADICVSLGGRVAEEILLGDISSGAWDDLNKATYSARAMIEYLGMGASLGLQTFPDYLEDAGRSRTQPSPETRRAIEMEVSKILKEQEKGVREILGTHKEVLSKLVEHLLDVGKLAKKDIHEFLDKNGVKPPEKTFRSRDEE